jgi:hypothetical protein
MMATETKVLPRDDFERDLFSRVLGDTFERWDRLGRPLTVSMDDGPNDRGEWRITIGELPPASTGEREYDLSSLLTLPDRDAERLLAVVGWAYIAERGGRAVPMYRVNPADQPTSWRRFFPDFVIEREADTGPTVDWDGAGLYGSV